MNNYRKFNVNIACTVALVALTSIFIMYIFQWLDYLNYIKRIGIHDINALKADEFDDLPFSPLFKYFIDAIISLYAALIIIFKYKLRLFGLLTLVLTAWLFVFPLQMYYSVLDFKTVVNIGIGLESSAVLLYILVLLKWIRSRKELNQQM